MPFREDIIPLKFDKFHFMTYEDWLQNEWNNRREKCNKIDLPYCQKVALTDPLDRVQFKANYVGDNLLPIVPDFVGVISTVSAGQAISTGIGTNAMTGYLIYNEITGLYATITNVVDADTVDISNDIFLLVGEVASTFAYFTSPNDIFHIEDQQPESLISKESYAGTATLTADAGLTSGSWYYMRVEVRNYESGQLAVKLGTTQVALLDTNGYQEFYGQASGSNVVFESDASQDFVGSMRVAAFELYELNTSDLTVVFSPNMSSIFAAGPPTPVAGALAAGVIMDDANATWGDITGGECECFYLALFSDPCYTNNYIQWDKLVSDCWVETDHISVDPPNKEVILENAEDGEQAQYLCMICPIECGYEYTLNFEVSSYSGGAVDIRFAGGIYSINGPGNYSFTRTPMGLCTGLDIFTITAVDSFATTVTMTIENISIWKTPVFEDATVISEQMCACDATECEVLIEYRNPVNVYGFPYEGDGLETHRNRVRFCGELKRAKMASNDYQVFKSSTGWYNTTYANLDAVELLDTEGMPPYLAKVITVAMTHNDVLINGVPYTMKDFSQTEEQENTELVSLSILVVRKDQTETFTYNA